MARPLVSVRVSGAAKDLSVMVGFRFRYYTSGEGPDAVSRDTATMNLNGRVGLVTGASRGIGRACAIKLALLGARVAVNYHTRASAADEVVREIKSSGGDATAIQGHVRQFTGAPQGGRGTT